MSLLARLKRRGARRRTPAPFIVGVPRSGTTLLRMMLDTHPELAIPPETHFIPKLIKVLDEPGDDSRRRTLELLTTHRRWPDFQLDADELGVAFGRIEPFTAGAALRAFYEAYARHETKPRWGDKTPGYARRMRKIQSVLPEAHFIHLIRDGRDVALSQIEAHHGAESVSEAAQSWIGGIAKARRNAHRIEHYMEARYEDLVTDAEPVLRQVCTFVDLPYDPTMLRYHERATERLSEIARDFERSGQEAIPADVRAEQHARVASAPQSQRAGRWRNEMGTDDREAFEAVAGELLAELGYEVGGRATV